MKIPPTSSGGQPQVLVVDDNPANLDLLTRVLEPDGYRILVAQNGEAALALAKRARPDLILLDVMMPGADGFETCRRLGQDEKTAEIPVLFISARADTASIVEGFRAGGVDYVTKPFQAEEVLSRANTHLRLSRLTRELGAKNQSLEQQTAELSTANGLLREEVERRQKAEDALQVAGEQLSAISRREAERWGVEGFVGKSKTISKILHEVRRLQNFSSVNVLINGESGTGKELVARAVHSGSSRGKGPFIAVNCVAIPEDLAESMFFGHVKGAFTGAMIDRKGYFELADEGTLFLDEIGDMSPLLQAKLLRVLEDGKVTPLGATREKQVNVRIVAATNADLEGRIAAGMFRQDLYFRLAQFTVQLPPLRMRKEDVGLLAGHFLELFATEMGMKAPLLTADA
ncbi:MAG TPA: sigma-54 dependent transcriptional regulator, partial [Verrucomicrobiaceae bacterium]